VVLGIKNSVAQKLGFVGRDVKVSDILSAIERKELTFAMTSASQSNSGASAYLGFLYALLGSKQSLSKDDLNNPQLQQRITSLLSGINRSSGSSGWLKELFLRGNFDAMVNYESIIIETNQELARRGREQLYVVYPIDGIVLSDSPLGFYNRGNVAQEKTFLKLQDYLLSEPVQKEIAGLGRRVGLGGMGVAYDKNVFRPEWGIQPEKILSPIALPPADVIYQALELYQTQFRKPSITVFCLDFSGSMAGDGERQVKDAMSLLLSPERARQFLIQPGKNDVAIVVPFNSTPMAEWKVEGNNPDSLKSTLDKILACKPDGGTDIYTPAIKGIAQMSAYDLSRYMPAVVVLTDGKSNTGATMADLARARQSAGHDIPVFSIMFGDASPEQLREMADETLGSMFDGRKDLVSAFRKVKGYN
jgi:Ca-activated chloride channel family protein